MTLVHSLILDVSDQDKNKVSSILLRAKVLAKRLKSEGLLKWVTNELEGYSTREAVPDYRVIYPAVMGNYEGHLGATRNVPLALHRCPDNMRKDICEFVFMDNCGAIEAMLASSSETHHRHFTPQDVALVRQCAGTPATGQHLVSLQAIFTDTQVAGVLLGIRHRLLDFLLALEGTLPDLTGEEPVRDASARANIERLAEEHLGGGGKLVVHTESFEIHMRDSYQIRQAGAVGPGARASHMTLQHTRQEHPADLQALSKELALLVDTLRKEAKVPEHQEAIGVVMAAQAAADKGDGAQAVSYLAKAGGWVRGLAEQIGVGAVVRYIVEQMTS